MSLFYGFLVDDVCAALPCAAHSKCTISPTDSSLRNCTCNSGYIGDGTTFCSPISSLRQVLIRIQFANVSFAASVSSATTTSTLASTTTTLGFSGSSTATQSTTTINAIPAPSPSSTSAVAVGVGVAVGAPALIAVVVLLVLFQRRRQSAVSMHSVDITGNIVFESAFFADYLLLVGNLAEFEINRESVTIVRELGSGNFSNVMEVLIMGNRGETTHAAAKMAVRGGGDEDRRMLYNEATLMREFHHENVVRLLGVSFSCDPCLLLLELAENVSPTVSV